MVLLDMFYYNVTIKYKSTLCSKATALVLFSAFIIIFAPLTLTYRSKGFWLKSYTFYEQPDVRFKYQYFFIAEAQEVIISCGNIPNITNIGVYEDCYMVHVREEDYNDDNKIDEIHFKVQVLNSPRYKFYSVNLFLIFDFKIHTTCPLQMESMLILINNFGLPITEHFVTGSLNFEQAFPLPCWTNYKDTRYNHSVLPDFDDITMGPWIKDVIYGYSRRNISTNIKGAMIRNIHGVSDNIEMSISLAIPETAIRYKPGLSQELKHFWQQYITIAIVFYWIIYKINAYIFRNKLIPAWERIPWKKVF